MRSSHNLLVCIVLLLATPAAGQEVRLVGRVIDDLTEFPLSQVEVHLRDRDGSTLRRFETDTTGTFEFTVRRVSAVRIQANRVGYRANTTPLLFFDDRRFFQLEVRLDPEAMLLAPLEVIAWSGRPENALHAGFRQRLQTGLGFYITREEVEARNPNYVSDLLREVPGVEVTGSGYGTRPSVRMVRAAGKNCTTQIFVDGMLMNRRTYSPSGFSPSDIRIDEFVSPLTLEGIEIYRGLATVPAEFLNPDAECGVIAIWTRRRGFR